MSRPSCLYCARKHLAQAIVLSLEALKGYPIHAWIAVGHLAEAEDELLEKYSDVANAIRDDRVQYMESGFTHQLNALDLIERINDIEIGLAGSDIIEVNDAASGDDSSL